MPAGESSHFFSSHQDPLADGSQYFSKKLTMQAQKELNGLRSSERMAKIGLFYLIKIGKEKYMNELYDHGVIFMNNIDYFRRYEDNELRGDKEEGIKGIEQAADIKLIHNGKLIAHGGSGQLKFHYYDNNGNIYSLMAITSLEDPDSFQIDGKNKRFGDYFVVITEVKDFIDRIEDKLKGLKYEYGLVKYYDSKKYSGPLDVFCKPDNFEYQREFRFFVKRNKTGPLKLKIGSIKDISYIFNVDKLDKIGIKLS